MDKISDSKYNPQKYHRRSIRLKDYDYSQAGAYFVTICTRNSEYIFGKVVNGVMKLNKYGHVVEEEWRKTARLRKDVKIDVFMVMPNHFHGIVMITEIVGARRAVPLQLNGSENLLLVHCLLLYALSNLQLLNKLILFTTHLESLFGNEIIMNTLLEMKTN